ncbi:DUF4145 domain-containing protein [Acinetobacter bereziniae]|uniref:DUF4145 domain-containing protein n=1 Tax=Acinetobacter bereziniae LMG 1003 = CIP 70.12 TaxID=981324 RepID=N9EV63_ACIBZ|nr:DUF4145 domain-containing protein [Acinetobacter bereziniae]ENV96620.1 hypothetical protein F938_02181 [Acinetobacter bereziniae LMG 1003 = CIP 70.12]MBJ9907741.1 DUF4145 domain-containing protein [Acinetobacter bereziniae]MBJ9929076.1 DUF4145 domain-containing protein [Acinetobacter bereziniae]MDG3556910.1 DUF4145 domain-containing protein [Acinetobacter bereziniae]MDP6002703.1 DUF4145 domain-containing protein [Acinetobacter bereziniae]
MSTFVFDCPNCNAKKSTFDVKGHTLRISLYEFREWYLFSTCRACYATFTINAVIKLERAISLKRNTHNNFQTIMTEIKNYLDSHVDIFIWFENFNYSPILPNAELPPEYIPSDIEKIFNEAAKCFAIGCFNASGAMFRLCLDITTKHILFQNQNLSPSANDNKSIHSRLNWIFTKNILPRDLEDLSRGIKDDGNDAAHDGTLTKDDAADLLDFTYILLERVYTEPARVQNAQQRRMARRQN